jgi:hypothetical protein
MEHPGDIFPINSTVELKLVNNNYYNLAGTFTNLGLFETYLDSSSLKLVEEIRIKIYNKATNWILIYEIDFF